MNPKIRIAFLYLDNSFCVYHSLSLAIHLHKEDNHYIEIFTTAIIKIQIDKILQKLKVVNLKVRVLRPFWHFSLPKYIEIKLQFRTAIFLRYKKLLGSYDLIVTTIYNDIKLKDYFSKNSNVRFVFTAHGTANRKYAFQNVINKFDFFFIKGNVEEKIRRNKNQLEKGNYAAIGYLKYDLIKKMSLAQGINNNLFNNNRQTIIYNPHWDKNISSFFKFGFQILDFFLTTDKYNLIFIPHSVLTARNKILLLKLIKYRNRPNIFIDLGSEACYDMTYMSYGDLYLGDGSSVAWEFILTKSRPCLFIDSNKLQESYSDENFLSWELGEVITNISNLENDIMHSFDIFQDKYEAIQEEKLKAMYHQTTNATKIAADSINKFLV